MQKDFHYDVIYVLAQWAGFSNTDSYIIAYSSQFVDDAADLNSVNFDNGKRYPLICSAHATSDFAENVDQIADKLAWVPFHFLPGNGELSAADGGYQDDKGKLICCADSSVAREMVRQCLSLTGAERNLYRLGITLHVYADTWAHQGFSGIIDDRNRVRNLRTTDNTLSLAGFADKVENVMREAARYLPLGHAMAVHYPDLPYLGEWYLTYQDERGEVIRNNSENFVKAANAVYKVLTAYKNEIIPTDRDHVLDGLQDLTEDQQNELRRVFDTFDYAEEGPRHTSWIKEINTHSIAGVDDIPDYEQEGETSWKSLALGDPINALENTYHYDEHFETSDWKLFYDALTLHRAYVFDTLLPAFAIDVDPYLSV